MIGIFAERFGIHPDKVYEDTSFDTLTGFILMWKEKGDFDDRYAEEEKKLSPTT